MSGLAIEELAEPRSTPFVPFAHPYYQRKKGFMATRAAFSHASFPAGTFAPGKVCKAYKFPNDLGSPKASTLYGIGSLGGNVPLSDISKFCSDNGYPTPNLKVLSIPGADTTTDPGGANVENNLDWQMIMQAWHYAYPSTPCNLILLIGPNSANGIADVTTALVKQGCNVINWSWGQAKSQWSAASLTYTEAAFAAARTAGVVIFAASGDSSLDDGTNAKTPDYPAASIYVHGVGGTALTVDASGNYLQEKSWGDGKPGDEGGGGGYAVGTPIPAWQVGVVPGTNRGVPDTSANADPNTGYQTWSDGTVAVIGGTSASSPLTCGLAGVVLAMGGSLSNFEPILYTNRKIACTDVALGSNGDPAGIGWDDSTGNGSPIGTAWASLFGATILPPPPGTAIGTFTVTANPAPHKYTGKFSPTSGTGLVIGNTYKLSN